MRKNLRIAFLTPWAVADGNSWSGVIRPMHLALMKHAEVVVIETGDIEMSQVDRGLMATLGRVSNRPYLSGHALATSKKRGKIVSDRVRRSEADVVLCVAASQDIAYADFPQPVVQVTDATFGAMLEYYPLYARLHPISIWQGKQMSQRSQAKTSSYSLASEWAKNALQQSGFSPDRCRVIPFGPSIWPQSPLERKPRTHIRVLVVASDWQRKGGDLAVAAVAAVRQRHPGVSLTVVGDAPQLPSWVKNLGRVSRDAMPNLYAEHDVLLELAAANAGGVTLTDAHAFGLPVIATDTGGVASIVLDGVSGILVDSQKDPVHDASIALEAITEARYYQQLAAGATGRYLSLLNWDVWALNTARLCEDVWDPALGKG